MGFVNDLFALLQIKEIRIFLWVLVLGSLAYVLLNYAQPLLDIFRSKKTKNYDDDLKAFRAQRRESGEKNFEIYLEPVQWSEKPLFAAAIKQVFLERSGYVLVVVALLYFVAKGLI